MPETKITFICACRAIPSQAKACVYSVHEEPAVPEPECNLNAKCDDFNQLT